MEYTAVNLKEKLSRIPDLWSPRIIAGMNDYHLKLARLQGEFVWHDHPETDEVFLVIKGSLVIEFHDGRVRLNEGELFVVPGGMEHRPVAEAECHILLVEPAGTVNTGEVNSTLTAPGDLWI